jgi:hypothetical protein
VADMGGPADPLMRGLFFTTVRLFDGLEQTLDNAAGALPAIFEAGGLDQARKPTASAPSSDRWRFIGPGRGMVPSSCMRWPRIEA